MTVIRTNGMYVVTINGSTVIIVNKCRKTAMNHAFSNFIGASHV